MYKVLSLMPSHGSLSILEKLVSLVVSFSSNPMNAVFTHYLFESVGIVTSSVSTDSKARDLLVQPLCLLLDKNVTEYIPYALQVLALLIEAPGQIGDMFKHLFGLLMNEELWKNFSFIPGMVRITQAYLFRAREETFVVAAMPTIASRASMLLGTTKFETTGFELVNSIFAVCDSDEVIHQIVLTLLTKLHHKRSDKLLKSFATSLCVVVAGASDNAIDRIVRVCDRIQPGLSTQVIRDLWMQGIGGMNVNTMSVKQKKVVFLGLAKLVTTVAGNADLANSVLNASQNMICVNPGKEVGAVTHTAEVGGEIDDSGSFEVSYSKLGSTINAKTENDYISHVQADPMQTLKQAVKSIGNVGHVAPQLLQWANA
jgi:hypothetical protein